MEDEFRDKVNAKAKELGLDYRLGDLVVSLKGNVGEILIATSFECSHIKGNFERYDKDKHKLLKFLMTNR